MTPIRPLRVTESRWRYAPHLLAIALLWAIAMTMDYRDQAETAQEQAQQMSAQMASCLRGVTIQDAFPKTYDERKWAAIEKNREIRRANERRYEACAIQCIEACR